MTDSTPVNARTDEPIALPMPVVPDIPARIVLAQAGSTIELIPPLDQMALELKALRQQAISTQAGIQQLQLEQHNQPFPNVLSGLPVGLTPGTALLGIGILILGGILTWSGAHRLRARSTGSKPAFVDSDSPPDDPQDSATLRTHESARVIAAALPKAAPALSPESEFPPDVARFDAVSGLDVNLEDLLPIKAPVIQPEVSAPDKPVAKINHAPEFDREAAADEVERVLKSLASKRAARSGRPKKTDAAISPERDNAMMILPAFDPVTDRRHPADQDRTGQEAALSSDQQTPTRQHEKVVQPDPLDDAAWPNFEIQDEPVADLQAVLPVVTRTTSDQDTDDEPDHEVQLSLAQEFESLGLTLGARELATEALDSHDTALSSYAQALLRQIEDEELANPGTQRSIF